MPVPADWNNSWTRVRRTAIQGGQSQSFIAESKLGDPQPVFIKELKHQDNQRARARFRREVSAYETLSDHPGIPNLIEDNSGAWEDRGTPLYLVLEFIEGSTLREVVRDGGPLSLDQGVACAVAISTIIERCHADEVLHRDLKPANIILRNDDPNDPIVVDFGLSFNSADGEDSDLTRVGEEVGNRFLRLPEHATRVRSPVSDVTQVAGLLLFSITGIEPRVLEDSEGRQPHQRTESVRRLSELLSGRALMRPNSLFDRAFNPRLGQRFQSMNELRESMEAILTPIPESASMDTLIGRLDEAIDQPRHLAHAADAARLGEAISKAHDAVRSLIVERKLSSMSSGGEMVYQDRTPYCVLGLAISNPSINSKELVQFRIELRGPDEFLVSIGGEEMWRGDDVASVGFADVVKRPIVELFLRLQGEG